jgi:phospholipid-binding lipoprotein MlaA
MNLKLNGSRISMWILTVLVLALPGCASVSNADPRDPWEPMNRRVYQFNEVIDQVAIRPAAVVYDTVVPTPIRAGVHNFLGNLSDVWSMANSALQLKAQATAETLMRVTVNTFLGLGGVLDVATEMRLDKRKEDFGQTLGHWGVKPGPYVMLPLLGPSTLRDAMALPVDRAGDVRQKINDLAVRNTLVVTGVVDLRADLITTIDAIKAAALDPYTFVRDGYLQKRENDVFDGNPPASFDYSEAP